MSEPQPHVIYDLDAHERLTERPWDDVRVRERIASIVQDAERSLVDGVWPNHPLDDDVEDDPLPDGLTAIYLGAAGMLWALHALGSTLDLASLADGALRRYRERPDTGKDVPSLLAGESGILLVATLLGASSDHRERLRERIVENERNPTWELMWGSPGTMLAARVAGLDAEYERSAAALLAEWDASDDGIWTQELYGRTSRYMGPVHGFAGNVHALRGYLSDDDLRHRIEGPLRRMAVAGDGLVNWLPYVGAERPNRLQWCHGAPGMVATLGDLMPRDLLVDGAELTWRAGPLLKGAGLCHGTAGNGYALLRAHALTGDREWLERARRFAVHALEQVERAREEHGRGRFTLFTGDVGAALFARSCLDVDPRFPTMDVW
jgi:Lanthionine synthetase C-like protein